MDAAQTSPTDRKRPAAYWQGVADFGLHVKTASQVAVLLGVTPQRVRDLAVHRKIGTVLDDGNKRIFLFTAADVDALVNRRDLRKKEGAA
jgi:hypothetical protein